MRVHHALGGADHLITQDLLPFWSSPRLDMPATRRLVAEQVRELVRCGAVACWAQAGEVLEKHDPHKGVPEGMEGVYVDLMGDSEDDGDPDDGGAGSPPGSGSPGPDGDEDGSDDESDDAGSTEGSAGPADDGDSSGGEGGDGGGPGGAVESSSGRAASPAFAGGTTTTTSLVLETPAEEATRRLKEECDDHAIVALRAEAARLRSLGEVSLAQMVDQRVAARLKRTPHVSNPMRLALRTEAVKRARDEAAERDRVAEDDARAKRLRLEAALTKAQAELERAQAKTSGQAFRRQELAAKAERAAARLAAQEQQREVQRAAENFAADWAEKLRGLTAERRADLEGAAQRRARQQVRLPAIPEDLWPRDVPGSCLRAITPHMRPGAAKVRASERFALVLFQGKRPQDIPPTSAGPA